MSMAACVPRSVLPQTAKSPMLLDLFRVPSIGHLVLLPNQRQRPGKQHGHQKQRADNGQRKPDVVLAIENQPRRNGKPGDEADRGPVDVWMKLIEDGSVVGDKFPGQESCLLLWVGLAAARESRRCAGSRLPVGRIGTAPPARSRRQLTLGGNPS